MSEHRYRVVALHQSLYPRPITFRKGALLQVGEEDAGPEGWRSWYFCHVEGQEPGWVPEQVFKRIGEGEGRALEDYTAHELDVAVGELLMGIKSLNGWRWCEKADGSETGWVPEVNLQLLSSDC